jgi:hypothetical protein
VRYSLPRTGLLVYNPDALRIEDFDVIVNSLKAPTVISPVLPAARTNFRMVSAKSMGPLRGSVAWGYFLEPFLHKSVEWALRRCLDHIEGPSAAPN